MKILITNIQLDHRTGTEVVTRDLEAGLRRRGHEVCVYTPRPGIMSDDIARAGGRVVDSLSDVPFEPDLIHGHHNVPTTAAIAHFERTPAIFVCHDSVNASDIPPRSEAVRHYVSVDLNCDARVRVEGGIPFERTSLIPNAVDLRRFARRAALPTRPRRAAVFSNYAVPGGYVEQIRAACREAGIEVDVHGEGMGTTSAAPEEILGRYDLVFAKARCALEALVTGCAVVVVDAGGLGGLVTSDEVVHLREWNFGALCLQRPVAAHLVAAEIARYDAADAGLVADRMRLDADLERALDAYEALYGAVVSDPTSAPRDPSTGRTWPELYAELVAHAGGLEALLRAGEGRGVDRRLSEAAAAQVAVDIVSAPGLAPPGSLASATIEIRNRSREELATLGSTPVQVSYRWLDGGGEVIEPDGERTQLSAPIPPGAVHRQTMKLRTPAHLGRFVLRVALVQEHVFWFDDIRGFSAPTTPVTVTDADLSGPWTLARLAELEPVDVVRDGSFAELGFVNAPLPAMMTFAESPRFVDAAVRAGAVAVLVPPDLAAAVPDGLGVLADDRPRAAFARLHAALASRSDFYGLDQPTTIHPSARVHPSAVVETTNVVIGPDVTVEANVSISGRTTVGAGSVIKAGATLGSAGFQTVTVDGRPTEMAHAGGIEIGAGCVVMANAVVARGVFRQRTSIGDGARVGNNAFVSHNTRIGPGAFVGHGAVVNGNVLVGADAWIGPGATVSNNLVLGDGCRVTLGATVFSDVAPGSHVSGLAAVDHDIALRATAELRRRRR